LVENFDIFLKGLSTAVDLDVEKPNLHLFVQPLITETGMALMPVPEMGEAKCTYCGASELCQFKAISVFKSVDFNFS
jgi:MinD superfamily P-loop ATPase